MDEKRTRVYICEDSLEGILTAVYDAYHSRYGHRFIQISEAEYMDLDLFCDYFPVDTDFRKAESVAASIRRKISYESWRIIMYAGLCNRKGKAQDIYRFLNYGYEMGGKIVNCLGEEHVRRVMFDKKTVTRELDRMRGFVRFSELADRCLFSRIAPKHNLIPLLAPHFADRFPEEKWMIYDINRKLAAIHYPNIGWQLLKGDAEVLLRTNSFSKEEEKMSDCWKTFFDTIAIEARTNLDLQQQMMPKYYQKYLTKAEDKSLYK